MICVAQSAIAFATVGGHAQSALIRTVAACSADEAADRKRGGMRDKPRKKRKKALRVVKNAR